MFLISGSETVDRLELLPQVIYPRLHCCLIKSLVDEDA